MSRSWREAWCVALSPERFTAVRRGALRASVERAACEPLEARPGAAPWGAAAEALARFLGEPGTAKGDLEVVLSNHFVRYQLVPWSAQVVNPRELGLYAAAQFEEVFGEVSAQWEIAIAPAAARAPRLAAAVDRALLEAIRAAAAASPLRLRSVQPYLMAAYNGVAARSRDAELVFMLVESGRACILTRKDGRWRSVSAATVADEPAKLAALLERELRLGEWSAQPGPSLVVHCAHRSALELPPLRGHAPRVVGTRKLAGLAPGDASFALVGAIA